MRFTTRRKTVLAVLALLAIAMLVCTAGPVTAKKPVNPPPPEPEYFVQTLGTNVYVRERGLNEAGEMCGEWYGEFVGGLGQAYRLSPADTDGDDVPDTWFRDVDVDGINDRLLGLGHLGIVPSDEARGFAMGLNDEGMVVGHDGNVLQNKGRAFLWMGGSMTDLGTAVHPTTVSYAKDVNNEGVVLGAFLRSSLTPTSVDLDWQVHHFVIVPRINGSGERVWFADDDADGLNDLIRELGVGLSAPAINDHGRIAGSLDGAAAVLIPLDGDGDGEPDTWFQDLDGDGENDLVHLLPAPADATGTSVSAINENDWIVGSWKDRKGTSHAALWRTSASGAYEFVDLGGTLAIDINDANVVVGVESDRKSSRPVIWQGGVRTKLQDLVDAGSPELGRPWAINNRGEIVAGSSNGGPVVLIPVP